MFINLKNLKKSLQEYSKEGPFDHCVIDDFFKREIALKLESEFPNYDSEIWQKYDNAIEIKKLNNVWNHFPKNTYQIFGNNTTELKLLIGFSSSYDIGMVDHIHLADWMIFLARCDPKV